MSRQGRGNSMCKEERAKKIEKRKCSWISRSKCDVQTHYVVYIKYVQIFVYELHLNKALKNGLLWELRWQSLPVMQETWVQSLGWEDSLEKEMATHSIWLPGKSHGQRSLAGQPLGLKRVGHDWAHTCKQQKIKEVNTSKIFNIFLIKQ